MGTDYVLNLFREKSKNMNDEMDVFAKKVLINIVDGKKTYSEAVRELKRNRPLDQNKIENLLYERTVKELEETIGRVSITRDSLS